MRTGFPTAPLASRHIGAGGGAVENLQPAQLFHYPDSKPVQLIPTTADLLCTACRIKLGRLPPLGFVAMREHLNFVNAESLRAILASNGFAVDSCGINRAGQLFAVARKFATVDAGSDKTVRTIS